MNPILKTCAVTILGTLVLSLQAVAADNPYKSAKVGEWVETVSTSETMGGKMEMKMKRTVVAKDAVSVTLRTVATMMGREMPPQDAKIMFDQPYQPYVQGDSDAKVTTLDEGDETITVSGKSYKCNWAKVKVVATKPMPMESTVKAWSSKDIPLGGIVKMESESVMSMEGTTMNSKTTMTLTGFGR